MDQPTVTTTTVPTSTTDEAPQSDKALPLTLSVWDIPLRKNFRISGASIGQLVARLGYLMKISATTDPKGRQNANRAYQDEIYRFFRTRLAVTVQIYQSMLTCDNKWEYDVKLYNLFGPLPRGMRINQDLKGGNLLINSKIGDVIQALKQRIDFIINRQVPAPYVTKGHQEYQNYFIRMQNQVRQFWDEIISLEEAWVACIDRAKKAQLKNANKAQLAFEIKKSFYTTGSRAHYNKQ